MLHSVPSTIGPCCQRLCSWWLPFINQNIGTQETSAYLRWMWLALRRYWIGRTRKSIQTPFGIPSTLETQKTVSSSAVFPSDRLTSNHNRQIYSSDSDRWKKGRCARISPSHRRNTCALRGTPSCLQESVHIGTLCHNSPYSSLPISLCDQIYIQYKNIFLKGNLKIEVYSYALFFPLFFFFTLRHFLLASSVQERWERGSCSYNMHLLTLREYMSSYVWLKMSASKL